MIKIIIKDKDSNIIRCSYSKKIIIYQDKIIVNNDIYPYKDFLFDCEEVSIFKFLYNNFYNLFNDLKKTLLRTITYFIISLPLYLMFISLDIIKNEIIQRVIQIILIIYPLVIMLKYIKKLLTYHFYSYLIIAVVYFLSISTNLLYSISIFLMYSTIIDLLIFIFYMFLDLYKYNKSSIDIKVIYGEKQ